MNETEASEFRRGHDTYVRTLSRTAKARLASTYRQELASRGQQLLYGGPASKDELVSALASLRYPLGQLNESTHVLYHAPGETWSACEHCHPHQGQTCECALGRVTA